MVDWHVRHGIDHGDIGWCHALDWLWPFHGGLAPGLRAGFPLNIQEWQAIFELYKDTPEYIKVNAGMDGGFNQSFGWSIFIGYGAGLSALHSSFPSSGWHWDGLTIA